MDTPRPAITACFTASLVLNTMALAISFPINLTLGLPYYWALVNY